MAYEIVAVRTEPSGDYRHRHIALVGYDSPHMPSEPIMIPPARVIERIAFGERFSVRAGDQQVDVTAGTCSLCGYEPYLEPQDAILTLPEK